METPVSQQPSPSRVAARHLEAAQPKRVTYKGRTYNLLWSGPTKHGDRAHLQFTDGSKDFWVDAHLVSGDSPSGGYTSRPRGPYGPPRGKYECPECGEYVVPGTICWETGARH